MTPEAERPFRVLPRLDDANREFWTSGERGELAVSGCEDCGYLVHPPRPVCPRCLSRSLAPRALSGRGVVHSVTVNHQPWNPTMPTPYAVGLIELDEQPGLRLMTDVVGCDPGDVRIGMRVRVVFEQYDDVWIPLFEPEARNSQSAPEGRQVQSEPDGRQADSEPAASPGGNKPEARKRQGEPAAADG
jgi:uncharacterized OB-fold protein